MLTQGARGTETSAAGNLLEIVRGGLEESLCQSKAMGQKPAGHTGSGGSAEVAREASSAGHGVFGHPIKTDRIRQVVESPLESVCNRVRLSSRGERLFDELSLPSASVGGGDHAASDPVGHLSALVSAEQVKAAIYRGGSSRGGDDVTVVAVEHVTRQGHTREHCAEGVGPDPMSAGGSTVEQPRFGKNESSEAETDDPRAAGMCVAHRLQECLGRTLIWIEPGRDDYGVSTRDDGEVVFHRDGEARHRLDRPGVLGTHDHVVRSGSDAIQVLAKDRARHGEVERADAVKDDHSDAMGEGENHNGPI